MNAPFVLINGEPGHSIDALDRGLAYGDGVFRTIAARNSRPEFWNAQMTKLTADAARLALPMPNASQLARDAAMVLSYGGARAVLKIILTRGVGGRGYRPPERPSPTRIVLCAPWPDYPLDWAKTGVAVRVCETHLSIQPKLAGVKHLNRLEQVLARAEWFDTRMAEGVMMDTGGHVISGTMSNLFAVIDDRLLTPDLSRCGIAGVMRGVIIAWAARRRLSVAETDLSLNDLYRADELFLTNSLIGVWPVHEIDGRRKEVGALTRTISTAVDEARTVSLSEFLVP